MKSDIFGDYQKESIIFMRLGYKILLLRSPSASLVMPSGDPQNGFYSVRVYAVIISKYTTKIVGTLNRQVPCVHGTQDQKQSTFNTFKPAQ